MMLTHRPRAGSRDAAHARWIDYQHRRCSGSHRFSSFGHQPLHGYSPCSGRGHYFTTVTSPSVRRCAGDSHRTPIDRRVALRRLAPPSGHRSENQMRDTIFKTGSERKQAQDDLRTLVEQAREERTELAAMLAQINGATPALARTSRTLDDLRIKADEVTRRC